MIIWGFILLQMSASNLLYLPPLEQTISHLEVTTGFQSQRVRDIEGTEDPEFDLETAGLLDLYYGDSSFPQDTRNHCRIGGGS